MKKKITFSVFAALVLAISIFAACNKEKDSGECRVCTALAQGPDQQNVQKEVCSDSEEANFRSEYSNREITCH